MQVPRIAPLPRLVLGHEGASCIDWPGRSRDYERVCRFRWIHGVRGSRRVRAGWVWGRGTGMSTFWEAAGRASGRDPSVPSSNQASEDGGNARESNPPNHRSREAPSVLKTEAGTSPARASAGDVTRAAGGRKAAGPRSAGASNRATRAGPAHGRMGRRSRSATTRSAVRTEGRPSARAAGGEHRRRRWPGDRAPRPARRGQRRVEAPVIGRDPGWVWWAHRTSSPSPCTLGRRRELQDSRAPVIGSNGGRRVADGSSGSRTRAREAVSAGEMRCGRRCSVPIATRIRSCWTWAALDATIRWVQRYIAAVWCQCSVRKPPHPRETYSTAGGRACRRGTATRGDRDPPG